MKNPIEYKNSISERPVAGAHVTTSGVHYCVWAPDEKEMNVAVERDHLERRLRLSIDEQGYWTGFDANGRSGDLYRFVRSDGRMLPDIASRFQPRGVHGPSESIDCSTYDWRCVTWIRPRWTGQAIYEIHLGAFTEKGTYLSAIDKLNELRDLGVDAIELMPVADFAGDRNWGYDGVALYAPARCYGRPDDLRALVDAAHERGLAVILDVVYNHLGPAGNYLPLYCVDYFHADKANPWGQSFNLDGQRSRPVRDFLVGNAVYWLDEFRFDGLRLDATHAIVDRSPYQLFEEITSAVHERGGFVLAEDERNDSELLRKPDGKGFGVDAVWSDDFHHHVFVSLTDVQESYFAGYDGTAEGLASTLAHGWTYRGQPYAPWAGRERGSSCEHLPASAFIYCIENHDQVGNRPVGERLSQLVPPRQFRAASMLLCLSPYVPLIFMGQEWAATTPFLFFTNHRGELGRQIAVGRRLEFQRLGQHWNEGLIPDPEGIDTFRRSRLRWGERVNPLHASMLALYRECLNERRSCLSEIALQRDNWQVHLVGGFVAIRYHTTMGERLLLVALHQEQLSRFSGPLEPPAGHIWQIVIHSEEKRFGGDETSRSLESWRGDGPAALWLTAIKEEKRHAAS